MGQPIPIRSRKKSRVRPVCDRQLSKGAVRLPSWAMSFRGHRSIRALPGKSPLSRSLSSLPSARFVSARGTGAAPPPATKGASGYRVRRSQGPSPPVPERLKRSPGTDVSNARVALKRHSRGATPRAPLAWADGPGKGGRESPSALTLPLPLERGTENPESPYQTLRVLKGGKG